MTNQQQSYCNHDKTIPGPGGTHWLQKNTIDLYEVMGSPEQSRNENNDQ